MKETLSKKETPIIIGAGVIIGIIAVALVYFGNPANMGFCIACFLRDTSGALGFHSAAAVQYIRPEIVGLVLGSCILALATKEFKPRGGSAPVTRFVIGMFVMIGCLMFLGCPFRMILRLAGGDFNAIFGLIGFIAGILAGVFFLKKGYTLKRSYKMQPVEGGIFPVVEIGILLLLIAAPAFIHFTEADGGPGAKHAAIAISLIAGLLVGALAQRTRLCMVGGIRDVVLFGEWKLLLGFIAILVSALIGNMILGYFNPGFAGLTFPMAIGIVASTKMSAFLIAQGNESFGSIVKEISGIQIYITTAIIGFVLYNFARMLVKSYKNNG